MHYRRILYSLPAVCWLLLIVILSFLPGKSLPSLTLFEWDKFAHFGMYAVLVSLIGFALAEGLKRRNLLMFLLTAVTIAVGILIEFGQEQFTTDRHFDRYDILANSLGSLSAWMALRLKG